MKALFFRKCTNATEYKKLSELYPDYGQELDFKIIETIKLSNPDEYYSFINNFLLDNDIIKKIKDKLFMDEYDCVHCAFFTLNGSDGYLVYSSGFNYARYVAYYKQGEVYV